MMRFSNRETITAASLIMLFAGSSVAPVHAQNKPDPEVVKLRAEVAKLREELDAAVREIESLKKAIRTGNAAAETGPLYRGKPARYWQAQFNDADRKLRIEAVRAIAALAQKDNKLIPVLIDMLKSAGDGEVGSYVANRLSYFGPEVLPTLIDIAEDRTQVFPRRHAIEAIGEMGAKAKSAVPVLIKALDDKTDVRLLQTTVKALGKIGPDARESIPALIKAFDPMEDFVKQEDSNGSRFSANHSSMNNRILDSLMLVDPLLKSELKRPELVYIDKLSQKEIREVHEAWQKVYETLVKKYLKSK